VDAVASAAEPGQHLLDPCLVRCVRSRGTSSRFGHNRLVQLHLPWAQVWSNVANRLRLHREAGRGHLLTEDAVRLETILVLCEFGAAPGQMVNEYLAPELAGGKIDLVFDPPRGTLIEFKYPRDSRTGFSPDTMTLGELLRDFVRVASVPAEQRWVVQVVGTRLTRYLQGAQARHGLQWATTPGADFYVSPQTLLGLPATARQSLGTWLTGTGITSRCAAAEPIDDGLTLYAYTVTAAVVDGQPGAISRAPVPTPETGLPQPAPSQRGARAEILRAIDAITTRSGRSTFEVIEVVQEMARGGSAYAESTVRTMVTSHMCASSMGAGSNKHADLERIGRGLYRLAGTARR
jgi:hypothetical protein